uniref:FAD-binding domain-containing protein n=1 Tax=Ananas comosus var. bracteatus TaxID=296719 RepID=A0A6V7QPV5_ANACO
MEEKKRVGKAVVVGGSIAGLSCAHALIAVGWAVTVIERSGAPPSRSPTGAGLGLDPQAREIIGRWIGHPDLLHDITVPLTVDLNRVTENEQKRSWTLTRDDSLALPEGVILWAHQFITFRVLESELTVVAEVEALQTGKTLQIAADLLVAADGCLSTIRQQFLPDFKLRYSGYCAWRGVLDFTGKENSDIIIGIQSAYPVLGDCLYFDLAHKTHTVIYELKNKRLNWIWYINRPEPKLKGNSVTMKVSNSMIEAMHEEAEKLWVPELARVMKETKEPFVNVIYDSDPLQKLFWGNVVLVGDAAHPTTPHGLRSTNMSILDAETLGNCLKKWGFENLRRALEEYEAVRLPVVSKQVIHSRKLGRMKQGLVIHDQKSFDLRTATSEEIMQLQQRNMPYFDGAPTTVG